HDAKIHYRNSLPDEINLRLVLGSHAHRTWKLSQAERYLVVAAIYIGEPEPAQLIGEDRISIFDVHTNALVTALACIERSIDVVIAKDASFDNASAVVAYQQRSRH